MKDSVELLFTCGLLSLAQFGSALTGDMNMFVMFKFGSAT